MIYLIGTIPGAIAGIFYAWGGTKLIKPNENFRWSLWASMYYKVMGFIIIPFIMGPLAVYFYSFMYGNKGIHGFLRYAFTMTLCCVFPFIIGHYRQNKKHRKPNLVLFLVFIIAFGWLLPLLYYLINV